MKTTARILFASLLAIASAFAADTSITALPAISTVSTSTVLPVVDVSGTPTTKKATVTQLINGLPVATGSTVGTMPAADKAKLDAATNANTASAIVRRDASGNFTAGTITATAVTGLAAPVNGSDAANKTYVDAAAAGLVIKSPARVGTVGANINLTGGAPNTLDGVTLALNDRILVKDQTDGKQNGIYYVSTLGTGSNGTWTRTTDTDTGAELVTGSYCFISSGTINANAAYTMVTTGTIVIGTSTITWNLFSQVTQIQAANIIGQIVAAQVQDAAINTAKFAAGLTPVEIVGTLPSSGNFAGRTVFLTTNGKLYRFDGSSFTASVPATDMTGQITTTQITDNAISSPKISAGAITAGKIDAGAVTAGTIAANAVTAGTISAGAVNTAELAAGAVNASKIAANTITAGQIAANTITAGQIAAGTISSDKLVATNLGAIFANLGTVTSGTLTASASVSVGSGTSAVSITSGGLAIAGGKINMAGDGANPWIRTFGSGSYSSAYVEMNGQGSGGAAPFFGATNGGTFSQVGPGYAYFNGSGITLDGANLSTAGTAKIKKSSSDGWTPPLYDGDNTIEFQWAGGLKVRIDGTTVLNITTTP